MLSIKRLKLYSGQIYLLIITLAVILSAYFVLMLGLAGLTGYAVIIDGLTGFTGEYVNTTYSSGYIQLAGNNLTGFFTSQVKDAGYSANWNSISWGYAKPGLITNEVNCFKDSYVSKQNPNNNYGSSGALIVRDSSTNSYRTYLSFNESAAGLSAELCLYANKVKAANNVSVYQVINSSWSESGLTWNNQPCGTSFNDSINCNLTALDSRIISSRDWYCFDVTGSQQYSFVLKTSETSNINSIEFDSRETSNKPYLRISYEPLTNLTFQVRSDDDNSSWGPFIGPDNTSNTYYTAQSNLTLPSNRFFQYKAYFYSNASPYSPKLYNVTINYTILNESPISININSPANTTYDSIVLELNVSFNKVINQSWYSLNGGVNQSLCNNEQHCIAYITADEGFNNLTVSASNEFGQVYNKTVYFTVDEGHCPLGLLFKILNLEQSIGAEYYPGDNVLISSMVTSRTGELVSGATVRHVIRYPNSTIYKLVNAYEIRPGYYKANFTLSDDAPLGTYQVEGEAEKYDCRSYDDGVFKVVDMIPPWTKGVSVQASSEVNYDAGETAIITATVLDGSGSLKNPSWINITITHRESGTVYVSNAPMNSSGVTGFYHYPWVIPYNATCGGYEVIITAKVDSTVTGISTMLSLSCWINKALNINLSGVSDNQIRGFNELFNLTSSTGAVNSLLRDCRGQLKFTPQTGLSLPNDDETHWFGDLTTMPVNSKWLLNASAPGSYNVTIQGLCSYGVSNSYTITNLTVHDETPVSLTKFLEPDIILANSSNQIEVNISVKNIDLDDYITGIELIDEIPYDFIAPNASDIKVWFINDSAEMLLGSHYNLTVSNLDKDPNIEVRLFMPNISADLGRHLEPNASIKISYFMNSSLMDEDEERIVFTEAKATDNFKGLSNKLEVKTLNSKRVLVRANKDIISNDPFDPANITEVIVIESLGGDVNNISFADYLPQGTYINNLTIKYCNHTSHICTQLINNTDYLAKNPINGTLPDSLPASIFNYNLSTNSSVNWDRVLYHGDNITLRAEAVIIGGGTWTLPANIFAFDPTYQKHIATEVHSDYSVPLFDVLLTILNALVNPGDSISALITLINVGGPKALADVFMTYSIKTMDGRLVTEKSETLAVITEKQRNVSILVPTNLNPGVYTYEALATYTGREAMATDVFEVAGEQGGVTINRDDVIYYAVLTLVGLGIVLMIKRLLPAGFKRKKLSGSRRRR